VPVNIWSADQNEYSEHEASDFENANEAVLNLEVRREVSCDERVIAERRVMSLSRGRVDDLSLSEADTLSSEEAYSEQELIETNQLVVLETNIKARGVDMLGLGGLESVESSAEGEEVAAMGGEEWCVEVAQETSQGFYLSLKASVSELAELNAPEEVTSEMLGDEVGEMEVRTERQMDTQVNSFEYCNTILKTNKNNFFTDKRNSFFVYVIWMIKILFLNFLVFYFNNFPLENRRSSRSLTKLICFDIYLIKSD